MDTPTHGARVVASNLTRFRLWAPDAESVEIEFCLGTAEGTKHPRIALNGAADGWFQGEFACGAGTLYRYVINGRNTASEMRIPDPSARAQSADCTDDDPRNIINAWSRVVDPSRWRWQHDDWRGRPWHEAVICEVHVGVLGGFRALINQLPYFQSLGVTALQLMPLAQCPGARNWGYDGVLPFAPQHSYGSPEDLQALVDAAHARELMIFVDVVYNHFGPDGNYLHLYASDFFREDVHTAWGAGIDFREQAVRDFFIENALMWLQDYRIDGLRFDAVHAIADKSFLLELARRLRTALPARHVHLMLENEDNAAELLQDNTPACPLLQQQALFNAQWNDDAHNVLHVILTGESEGYYADFSDDSTRKLARCLAQGFIYQGEKTLQGKRRGQPSDHLPPTAFINFLQNHDQIGNRAFGERLITLTDSDRLTAATAMLLLSPMIPLIFMGEEQGSRSPFLYFTDHQPELAQAITEGRRKEFSRFLQFSENPHDMPAPNEPATFQACYPWPQSDVQSQHWLGLYTRLLALRQQHVIPQLHRCSCLYVNVLADQAVSACWQLADGTRLLIDINLGVVTLRQPDPEGETLFSHGVDLQQHTLAPGSVHVRLRRHYD